jgi:serine/threonine protein phosphatase PrpC
VNGEEAAIANIGDSRVYLYRSGKLIQLTVDDTWLNAVMARDALDTAALDRHPMRNVLTQVVGSQKDVEVHTADLSPGPDDFLLICSDGLHCVLKDHAICAVLAQGGTAEELAKRLVANARSAGGPDNITCIVLGFGQ